MRCYLGLGSNLGDKASLIKAALDLLQSREIAVKAVSSAYETEPIGYLDQPDFLNAVAEIETDLAPRELLERTKSIERQVGAKASFPNGPREIDIDILLCGDRVIQEDDLEVPHPRMTQRAFVLVPLAEIAPDLVLPDSSPVCKVAADLSEKQRVEKTDYRF